MFQHEDNDVIQEEIVNEEEHVNVEENVIDEENVYEDENVNDENLSKIINIDENDEAENLDNLITNSTFINPSQFEQSSSGLFFICDKCDFVSSRKSSIKEHKETTHNWCTICLSTFKTQEELKNHRKDLHGDK